MGTPNMGESNSGGNKTTYTILYGSFRRRVEKGTEGSEERELKKGKNAGTLVSELLFDNYAGYIKKIQLHDSDFGQDLCIEFSPSDKGEADARIYIPLYSPQGRSFINHILSAEPERPIKLALWRKNADSKTYLYMSQWTGEKWEDVERKFNDWDEEASQLKGLPAVTMTKVNNEDVYDYGDHTNALTDLLQKDVLPRIQKDSFLYDPKAREEAVVEAPNKPVMGGGLDEEDDDLPF